MLTTLSGIVALVMCKRDRTLVVFAVIGHHDPKLTCGEGNVFIGCIAAYNADDGWDLFAKSATGPIGKVEIRGCAAYRNGYLMVKPGSTKSATNKWPNSSAWHRAEAQPIVSPSGRTWVRMRTRSMPRRRAATSEMFIERPP